MDNPVCGKRTPKASVLAAKMNFKKMARLKFKVKGGEKNELLKDIWISRAGDKWILTVNSQNGFS